MHTCFGSIHINCLWEKYEIVSCIIDAWGHMEILPKCLYTGRKECRRIRGFLNILTRHWRSKAPAGQIDLCSVQIWNGPALQQTCKPPKGKNVRFWVARLTTKSWNLASLFHYLKERWPTRNVRTRCTLRDRSQFRCVVQFYQTNFKFKFYSFSHKDNTMKFKPGIKLIHNRRTLTKFVYKRTATRAKFFAW